MGKVGGRNFMVMVNVLMIVMGTLGILIYNLFKAKEYITAKTFSLSVFINDNLGIWLWAFCVIVVSVTILQILR